MDGKRVCEGWRHRNFIVNVLPKSTPLGVGHLSQPGWVRGGPMRRRGQNSTFRFLEVVCLYKRNVRTKFYRPPSPMTFTWPHMRRGVGLEEGEY